MLNQALKTLIKQIKFMRGTMPFKTVTYIITIQAQWELIEIVTTCHQVKLWVKPIELRIIQIWTNTIQDWEPTIMNIEAKDTSKLLTSRNRKNICKMPVLKSWLQENLKNFSHLWLINEMEVIIIANRSCHLSIKIECLQWSTLTNLFHNKTSTTINKNQLSEVEKTQMMNMETELEEKHKSTCQILIKCDKMLWLK